MDGGRYISQSRGIPLFSVKNPHSSRASSQGNQTRRINHSDEPNVRALVLNVRGVRTVCLYAAQQIAEGTELTFDYGRAWQWREEVEAEQPPAAPAPRAQQKEAGVTRSSRFVGVTWNPYNAKWRCGE